MAILLIPGIVPMLQIHTHALINQELCGTPVELSPGRAIISMTAQNSMAVDNKGLIHGGFIFGLADHAAMLAVNHPNVVLASAEVRFLLPVMSGDELIAEAHVADEKGKKRIVEVKVTRDNKEIFSGIFHCAVLDRHVLELNDS